MHKPWLQLALLAIHCQQYLGSWVSAVVNLLLFVIHAPPPESQSDGRVSLHASFLGLETAFPSFGNLHKTKSKLLFSLTGLKKIKKNTTTITKRFNRNMRSLLYLKRHIIPRSAMGVILCLDFFCFKHSLIFLSSHSDIVCIIPYS